MNHPHERLFQLFIPRGYPPELLQLAKQTLHAMTLDIAVFQERPRVDAILAVGDIGEYCLKKNDAEPVDLADPCSTCK